MRILGFDLVLNLALGLVLSGTLRLPESAVRGAPPVWLEAVFTATAMEHIGRRLPLDTGPSPGSCYLTGLLANDADPDDRLVLPAARAFGLPSAFVPF